MKKLDIVLLFCAIIALFVVGWFLYIAKQQPSQSDIANETINPIKNYAKEKLPEPYSSAAEKTSSNSFPSETKIVNGQDEKEKYEPVSTSEFDVEMQLSGRVDWDKTGLANGGPIESFSFWGHKIDLTSNMIKDGFISTKDYGKILIRTRPDFTFGMELTPTQQKSLKELKNL